MNIKLRPEDILFSRYVRLRADNHCEYCGQWKDIAKLQNSHFHGRRKASTRFDEDNVSVVCFECHNYFHEHPNKHDAFFRRRLGSERYDLLNIRAEVILRRSKSDIEELKQGLKEKIKLLEGNNV